MVAVRWCCWFAARAASLLLTKVTTLQSNSTIPRLSQIILVTTVAAQLVQVLSSIHETALGILRVLRRRRYVNARHLIDHSLPSAI
jgi:hypothetical protein